MSVHPLELSARLIDTGATDTPPNRITQELSELADGVAIVESFSHVVAVDTGDGLVTFDASSALSGQAVVESLRTWSDEPIHTLVYTHGHLDHVGGSRAVRADAEAHGRPTPRVLGHARILPRFARYDLTSGYNRSINMRQFGGAARAAAQLDERPFLAPGTLRPDVTYDDRLVERIGDLDVEYHACRGETDDHTWTWIPQHRMISAGDQFIWNFPNCGNPQKVQRYPIEWAESLRAMAAKDAELFVPAHGLPIAGRERIRQVLDVVATTLERLVAEVLDGMNAGAPLDQIVHTVKVPDEALALPYLRPLYDEPEFVIRNIWRLFGGWWDGLTGIERYPEGGLRATARLEPLVAGRTYELVAGRRGATDFLFVDGRLALQLDDPGGARRSRSHTALATWASHVHFAAVSVHELA